MGRVKTSFCIIALIIIFSVAGLMIVKNNTDNLINAIEEAQQLMDKDQDEEAIKAMDKVFENLDSYETAANIFIRSDKVTGIHTSLAKIKPLMKKDNDELNAEFESVKTLIRWIYKSELPRVGNIF